MIRQSGGLPAFEHTVLAAWTSTGLPARRDEAMAGRPAWTCYESPPLGGGLPGVHDIAGRAVADLYLRFMAMRGYQVTRRGLLSCHGLPVEVGVESELGVSGAAGIEEYGDERFAARCRESVLRHGAAFAALDARLGCWPSGPVARTMDASYIETVWRLLSEIFAAGLLVKDDRIVPYCPRCQTPLSAIELGQPGVHRPSPGSDLIVKFRVTGVPEGAHRRLLGADLLVAVGAPWTLTANAAIAVHPHEDYAIARRAGHEDRVVVADARLPQVLGEDWHVAARITGADLAAARYAAPLATSLGATSLGATPAAPPATPADEAEREVVASYLVNVRAGTGLQHLAPAYSVQDREVGKAHGLPAVDPLGPDGRFPAGVPVVGGLSCTEADRTLAALLADRGLVFSQKVHERTRPHCWRCGTPLLFRSWSAWHIRVAAIGSRLGAAAGQVRWQPPLSESDRLHGWLRGEADWTVSRSRYWGTPLPIWECEQGHHTCVSSLAELADLAEHPDLAGLDLHRPLLDSVRIRCPSCGIGARRVPHVLDVWFDAAALPLAAKPPAELADLVVETADHAGAWSFALAAAGALTRGRAPYLTALRTGQVLDSAGRPMTRQSGNLAEPLPLIERYGADAVRWFFALAAPPGTPRAVSETALSGIAGGVLAGYRDAAAEFVRCARAAAARGDPWAPGATGRVSADARPLPDRWLLNELRGLVIDVSGALDDFEPALAGQRISGFIELLTGWYLPRSAARLWPGPGIADSAAAFATLQECLDVLTRVLAPVAPFLTEHVWTQLHPWLAGTPDSVHLASWPVAAGDYDDHLAAGLLLVRRLGNLAEAARSAAGVSVTQPLARGVVEFRSDPDHDAGPGGSGMTLPVRIGRAADLDASLRAELARSLNVRSLHLFDLGPDTDEDSTCQPDGRGVGWAVAAKDGELVALDVALDDELASEGLAHEVIAVVAEVRHAAERRRDADGPDEADRAERANGPQRASRPERAEGPQQASGPERANGAQRTDGPDNANRLDATNRAARDEPIALWWHAERADVAQALREHTALIAAELRLDRCLPGPPEAPIDVTPTEHADAALGLKFWLGPIA